MAANITYVSALTNVLNFARDNGYANTDELEKVQKLIDQKSKGKTNEGKSDARKANEAIADTIPSKMEQLGVTTINNKWVRDNINDVNTAARATAVLKVAVDLGYLTSEVIQKSATRSELTYHIVNNNN